MLEKIRLYDFQAHREREVTLAPGVTSIVGPSDVGKSAILRALGWVCLNEPSGEEFISWWGEQARVGLWLDGTWVVRERGNKLNQYRMKGGGEPLVAFGQGKVPDQIAKLINVGPMNFQWQIDPPLWFKESPGQVSRNLNAIVDLGAIDDVLAAVNREVSAARAKVDLTRTRLEEAEAKVAELGWVKRYAERVTALEQQELKQVRSRARTATLRNLYEQATTAAKTQRIAALKAQAAGKLAEQGERATAARQRLASLDLLHHALQEAQEVARTRPPDITKLEQQYRRAAETRTRSSTLNALVASLRSTERELCLKNEEKSRCEAALAMVMQESCPLCGRSDRTS